MWIPVVGVPAFPRDVHLTVCACWWPSLLAHVFRSEKSFILTGEDCQGSQAASCQPSQTGQTGFHRRRSLRVQAGRPLPVQTVRDRALLQTQGQTVCLPRRLQARPAGPGRTFLLVPGVRAACRRRGGRPARAEGERPGSLAPGCVVGTAAVSNPGPSPRCKNDGIST
jgi:hypothetical protein